MSNKRKVLIGICALSYLITIIATFIGNQYATELMAIVTVLLIFTGLMSYIKYLGPHKFSTTCMGLGFLCIALGYIYRFVNHFVANIEAFYFIWGIIYLMPSVFFALNETTFMLYKLKGRKRDISHLFSNCFAVSIVGYVLIYKFFSAAVGSIETSAQVHYLLFIFLAFFVVMMGVQTFYLVGEENIKRGTLLTTIAMLIYELMDIQYIYLVAIGKDPENYFEDLVYMLTLIVMTMGIAIQVHKKYYFEFQHWDYTEKSTRLRVLISAVVLIITGFAAYYEYLSYTEANYIVIVLMAYMIMTYILRTDSLTDELLDKEKKQNIILEEKVEEQTKNLMEINKKLELLSSTDMLTGLYNRWYAGIFLDDIVMKYKNTGKKFALFAIDLNHFKPINDTYGHEMGDKVLEEFGNRMRELPDEYTSFRMGGDEFLIFYRIGEKVENLNTVAEKLQTLFNTPVRQDTYVFNLSASIGISIYPQDSVVIEDLLQYADTAMYSVKQSGHKDGYKYFNSGLITLISAKAAIEERLRTATPEGDFILYYQPQVNIKTGEIIGAEVFPHLKGVMEDISPSEIIPVAEECGFMSKLGIWIIYTALNQISKWNKNYNKAISLTINLSPLQLIDEEYASALKRATELLEFSPSMVTLDVSNAVIMGAASSAKHAMKELHEEGYMLSLNDFGGGDINLSYIHDCDFNGLKLSRSLVKEAENDTKAKVLINAIMAFAEQMGIVITAVGIENKEQSESMKELGIYQHQGYFYGRPMNAESFEAILKEVR
ncbi:putative bifunctional diguanylate cyclase/phosphodiesterase [Butyrivibrio sp. WCE2006]|uniref:putative bifunctional diguanylate cyclase/phosphodiesterase n=1 Tax=Butyrivibrio sp. WCE2006 TaxID=1410611 RepID=UPI0005D2B36C|nr:EAL domain-containing protein [Butyrivibrio sp. WCE2006]